MKIKKIDIENFRKFKNISFNLGKRITVISGINGIGKSSILALMASTVGVKNKRLNGKVFQPKFTDSFTISSQENFSDYQLFITFDKKYNIGINEYELTKRVRFKNDSNSNRGIRPIPLTVPTTSSGLTQAEIQREVHSSEGRIHIPTIYLSLSRLLPLGETRIRSSEIKSQKISRNDIINFFSKCYNSVLSGSIDRNDSKLNIITKDAGKYTRDYASIDIRNTTNETLSVGQDNLNSIVSALTDFWFIKQSMGVNYPGGILCIDEVDASLHPSAVYNLFNLLKNAAEDLDLQIIVTSHSLTVLKEIISLESKDSTNYKLIYFEDSDRPRLSRNSNSFEYLKADMFDNTNYKRPQIKVYCEDKAGALLFKLLFAAYKEYYRSDLNLVDFNIIPMKMGGVQLKSLETKDTYFQGVLIVPDGDARTKEKYDGNKALKMDIEEYNEGKMTLQKSLRDNVVFLPTFYSPEVLMYKLFQEYLNNTTIHNEFWTKFQTTAELGLWTFPRIKKQLYFDDYDVKYDSIHENSGWLKEIYDMMKKSDFFNDYCNNGEYKNYIQEYFKYLDKGIKAVNKTQKSKLFS